MTVMPTPRRIAPAPPDEIARQPLSRRRWPGRGHRALVACGMDGVRRGPTGHPEPAARLRLLRRPSASALSWHCTDGRGGSLHVRPYSLPRMAIRPSRVPEYPLALVAGARTTGAQHQIRSAKCASNRGSAGDGTWPHASRGVRSRPGSVRRLARTKNNRFDPRGGVPRPALECDPRFFGEQAGYIPSTPARRLSAGQELRGGLRERFGGARTDVRDVAGTWDSIRAASAPHTIRYFGYSYGNVLGQVYATVPATAAPHGPVPTVDPGGGVVREQIAPGLRVRGADGGVLLLGCRHTTPATAGPAPAPRFGADAAPVPRGPAWQAHR